MADRRPPRVEVEPDSEYVHVDLNALSTLVFAVEKGAPSYSKAMRLDAHLLPVRERAREALRAGEDLTEALADCWKLVAEAGRAIDPQKWYLRHGTTTRTWAGRHVERARRARELEQERKAKRS